MKNPVSGILRSGPSWDGTSASRRGFLPRRSDFLEGKIRVFGTPGGETIPNDWPKAGTLLRVPKVVGIKISPPAAPLDYTDLAATLTSDLKAQYQRHPEFFVDVDPNADPYPFAHIPITNAAFYPEGAKGFGTNLLAFYIVNNIHHEMYKFGTSGNSSRLVYNDTGLPVAGDPMQPNPDNWFYTNSDGSTRDNTNTIPDEQEHFHYYEPPLGIGVAVSSELDGTSHYTHDWSSAQHSANGLDYSSNDFYINNAPHIMPQFPKCRSYVYADVSAEDSARELSDLCRLMDDSGAVYGGVIDMAAVAAPFFIPKINDFFGWKD